MKRRRWLIFNDPQLKKLATICADIGMVSLASVILPAIFEKFNIWQLIVGVLTTVVAWIYSLWLLSKI